MTILWCLVWLLGTVLIAGPANHADPSHGANYLAMRLPRGSVVTIRGAGGEWRNAVVTDFGPSEAGGKVADIALGHWLDICGLPASRGVCMVEVEIVSEGPIRLPATDTAP